MYQAEYQNKKREPEQIAAMVQSGWSCCTDIATAIPPLTRDALGKRAIAGEVTDITLHTMLDLMPMACLAPESAGIITPVSWFSGGGLRQAVNEGRGDIMPCYYRDMPALFRDYVEIDALFLTVAPMDRHGWFSAGITGSNSAQLIEKARHIFLEVNSCMPRVPSSPRVHISRVDAFCECSRELPVSPPAIINEVSRTIGGLIAEEVADGSTIQLGIGAIPEAVGIALKDKHDLGIHTELFTDSMVELIKCGAVTNAKKPIYKGKSVATFAYGSNRIYNYVNDIPLSSFCP